MSQFQDYPFAGAMFLTVLYVVSEPAEAYRGFGDQGILTLRFS